jgi:pimeloyl-ACP methyl ester carboxylesterase
MYGMEKVAFQNSSGLNLVGVLHKPESPTKTAVIVAHGFTSNKDRERLVKVATGLATAGIAALRVDFGGSGESDDREITIAAQVDDLQSAIRYVKQRGYQHVGVLGESLGGITALEAYRDEIEAMVLWAPVTKAQWDEKVDSEQRKSLEDRGFFIKVKDNRQFKIPQVYVHERRDLNRQGILAKIKIPVMIVHGSADETIPIQDSEGAIDLLPKGSVLEKIENAGHKMDGHMDTVIPKTVSWFKAHLP